jgi:hypothetical protein
LEVSEISRMPLLYKRAPMIFIVRIIMNPNLVCEIAEFIYVNAVLAVWIESLD